MEDPTLRILSLKAKAALVRRGLGPLGGPIEILRTLIGVARNPLLLDPLLSPWSAEADAIGRAVTPCRLLVCTSRGNHNGVVKARAASRRSPTTKGAVLRRGAVTGATS